MVLLPDGRFEPLARRVADRQVGQRVVPRVGGDLVRDEAPERVVGRRADDVVAQGAVAAVGHEDGVVEERFERGGAAVV